MVNKETILFTVKRKCRYLQCKTLHLQVSSQVILISEKSNLVEQFHRITESHNGLS